MKVERLHSLLQMAETAHRTGFTLPSWWGPDVRKLLADRQLMELPTLLVNGLKALDAGVAIQPGSYFHDELRGLASQL